jgi:photosystem II stability/assembly factor-like uncharacterized protein
MRHFTKHFIAFSIVVILSGCTISIAGQRQAGGGVYVTPDQGETWQHRVAAGQRNNRPLTISNVTIHDLIFDRQQALTVYAVTNSGLYASYDAGINWQVILGSGASIASASVHPRNSAIIYASVGKEIYQTTDGGATWRLLYTDPEANGYIAQVQVDSFNVERVLAATGSGNVLLSEDGGTSWRSIHRIRVAAQRLHISTQDTRTIYLVGAGELHRSTDGGGTWTDLTPNLRMFGETQIFDMVINPNNRQQLLIAVRHGILRSADGGQSWGALELLSAPSSIRIRSLTTTRDFNDIYYVVAGTMYHSTDGGSTWESSVLPTSHTPSIIRFAETDANNLYLGFIVPEKRGLF